MCIRDRVPSSNIAVLSGPNFAAELTDKTPSVMVIASENNETISSFKNALQSEYLIIYSSDDVVGVEISAIFKNILAISMGIIAVSYTHLRAHETGRNLVCRLLLEKK